MSARSIPFEWRHYRTVKGGLIEEHTAVVLERVLANFDGVLTVFIGDAARTTDSSGLLWLELRRCGGKTGEEGTLSRGCTSMSTEQALTSNLVIEFHIFVENRGALKLIFSVERAPVVSTSTALGDGAIHAIAGL